MEALNFASRPGQEFVARSAVGIEVGVVVHRFVSLGVVASALVVALGVQLADPIIGLTITLVILKITWDSWNTVRRAAIDLDHVGSDEHDHGGGA